MIKDLIRKNRSYRRFFEDVTVPSYLLHDMIENARLSASGRNAQALKYFISANPELNEKIFHALAWAGYLKNWDGPERGERPGAYLVQMHDTSISGSYYCDDGIAAQSILLTAVEKGFGGCIIASVKKEYLTGILDIPGHLRIIQVIALGKPKEIVVIEEMKDNKIEYWRDENQVHHVPKRSTEELIFRWIK